MLRIGCFCDVSHCHFYLVKFTFLFQSSSVFLFYFVPYMLLFMFLCFLHASRQDDYYILLTHLPWYLCLPSYHRFVPFDSISLHQCSIADLFPYVILRIKIHKTSSSCLLSVKINVSNSKFTHLSLRNARILCSLIIWIVFMISEAH